MFASTRRGRNGPVPTLACLTAPPHGSFPTSMLPLLFLLLAGDTTGYWQQQVAYQIAAALDEPSGVLTGHVRISYVNRSPDTLRDFYVHQYLNAFRPAPAGPPPTRPSSASGFNT